MSKKPEQQSPDQISRRLLKLIPLLRDGKFQEGITQLEALARCGAPHAALLYNLGLAYSELGQLDEAIIRLNRSAELDPESSNTWVGAGTNYMRMGRHEQAHQAFMKAIEVDPGNPYALKALAIEDMEAENWSSAIEKLEIVDEKLQSSGEVWVLLGIALNRKFSGVENSDERVRAEELLQKALRQKLPEATLEVAKAELTKMASVAMKRSGAYRFDVVMYFVGAMEMFEAVGPVKRGEIIRELAISSGEKGLKVNEPEVKYTLQSIPGKEFSGMHLLSILYAGVRLMGGPFTQFGMNFDSEWAMATGMWNNQNAQKKE